METETKEQKGTRNVVGREVCETLLKRTLCLGDLNAEKYGRVGAKLHVEVELTHATWEPYPPHEPTWETVTHERIREHVRLSISGHVWNLRHTDHETGGQCLDLIDSLAVVTDRARRIKEIWERWHLNDMRSACAHQARDGWTERTSEKVTLYHWRLTMDAISEQKKIGQRAIRQLQAGSVVQLDAEERELLAMEYARTTWTAESPGPLYEAKRPLYDGDQGATEEKTLGRLKPGEHPDGLLCRQHPECGYRYGTAWLYEPIPEDVLADLRAICGAES